jgi:hypothetical protein
MTHSRFTYHPDGTVTFNSKPDEVIATWKRSPTGGYDVFALPNGDEQSLAITASPRSLADDYLLELVQLRQEAA